MRCDVVVVGLGPAGAHFSYLASKHGYKVVALEKEVVHKSKTCAGGISAISVKILRECYRRIPSEVVERKIDKLNLVTQTYRCSLNLPKVDAFTTRRLKFDGWLVDEAVEKGTIVKEQCKLKGISFSKESVVVEIHENGSLEEIQANVVIGAYGMRSSVSKMVGMSVPKSITGVQYELELPELEIERAFGNALTFIVDTRFSRFGYVWIFPKGDSIAVGLNDRETTQIGERLRSFIRTHERTSRLFKGVVDADLKMSAALLPSETLIETHKERMMLIGDAAGFGDRITGEGISYALQSAGCAFRAFNYAYGRGDFSADTLRVYRRLWESAFGLDLRYGKKLQKIIFDEDPDGTWSQLIQLLCENEKFQEHMMGEMIENFSMARAIVKLPIREKLLLLKTFGYKNAWTFIRP